MSSISYFHLTLPLLVDSTHFLVIINRSPFCLPFPSILNLCRLTSPIPSAFQLRSITFYFLFRTFAFFFKPTPASIVYWTRILEITSTFYWMWWHFIYHKTMMLYKAHELFMNTRTVGHHYWHTSVLLYRLFYNRPICYFNSVSILKCIVKFFFLMME